MTTLPKLRDGEHGVKVPDDIAARAQIAIERMVAIGARQLASTRSRAGTPRHRPAATKDGPQRQGDNVGLTDQRPGTTRPPRGPVDVTRI